MTTRKMNSADHKKIICDLMGKLLDVMTMEELESLQGPLGNGWISYKSESRWKRDSKRTVGDTVIRAFRHATLPGEMLIKETMIGPDLVRIEMEMGRDLPKAFTEAIHRIKDVELSNGTPARLHPDQRDSILDTPKPSGFGDFS